MLRAAERAEMLRVMNGGNFGVTLSEAARACGLLDVRSLLAAGADAGAMDGSALYWACCFGHLRVAEALLDAGGTLVPDDHGEAMHIAANHSHTACCELLLDRGVDVQYCTLYGDALYYAVSNGHLETVAFLLDRGADAWCELAMQVAAEEHYDAVVALLLERRIGGAAQ